MLYYLNIICCISVLCGVRTAYIMQYAHTRRCPYTRGYMLKRSRCIFNSNLPFYHRNGIYKYPTCQIPFNPKKLKSEIFKIFSVGRFFIIDKIYIYTGIMVFFIFPHIKIWLPRKRFVYLHQN